MSADNQHDLAEQAYQKALRYELDYGCCPQCVLTVAQETLGGIDDSTIKASHGLSGGGGLMGQGACGAHQPGSDHRYHEYTPAPFTLENKVIPPQLFSALAPGSSTLTRTGLSCGHPFNLILEVFPAQH